ncbi:MAG: Phosphoenolpyruvate synthase [Methanosaeta sp. PtaB.Bin039]|nr:MAG: Phosphoenolpyruvate synthase [Methanosaeta sp. PtaB.Bin039]OPY46879.1 MAG: Phosphoenolpyruvate synthase [Methanosaeta sp. PtaU1.Bin028]HOT07134.1 phosphoenolpyruvate synthase [Methanotrichaceae archaeon]HQF16855.1 phosphoenolpyruvate synthase [Methanotrichaceae archaeon]HQI91421.1 phosphoenolpyruvate synthase [Methanotrichaceae archaeon]
MSTVVWLEEVGKEDIPVVGGKGASLGEMIGIGVPVPGGFAVTAQAFRDFIERAGIAQQLFASLNVNVSNQESLLKAEAQAKKLIMEAKVPHDIEEAIKSRYNELCEREGEQVFVAVRSSATAEDLPDASFAGQQETYLNMRGADAVFDAVRKCWASLYGARAIFYRVEQGFDHEKVNLSAIVQIMVDSEKSGVMFSSQPSTGQPVVVIEAAWGLGETVVSGSVSPDNYEVDRSSRKIVNRYIASKEIMTVRDRTTGETVTIPVPADKKEAVVLTDSEILDLARYAEVLEKHYGMPQDIEFGVQGGKIYILQSRPITTIASGQKKGEPASSGKILISGLGASPGVATGEVRLISSSRDLDKIKQGDIMVTVMTMPDMVPGMRRAGAIVTDEGGMACHAAIVSRELGCPAVVGSKKATKVLKEGMLVTVDGTKGQVYEGRVVTEAAKASAAPTAGMAVSYKPITATEVKVNISEPSRAQAAAATLADGVGLLRIEHMILEMGKTPNYYIQNGLSEQYVDDLVKNIKVVADAFFPRPVWVRTLDAPTDEFRAMQGGEGEPHEHNPMLGWRGIRRDLTETDHFRLEVSAFKKLHQMGLTNVGIMLPLVQHFSELRRAKEIMVQEGLDLEKIDVGIMVETPAAALTIDEFIDEGLDFVSFGTNDLTQYTLAVDRNNENVAPLFTELHPAVIKLIEYVVERCRDAGVVTSICGQAGSYPEMAKRLVEIGISSISANIDAVAVVRETVARSELRMMLESLRE